MRLAALASALLLALTASAQTRPRPEQVSANQVRGIGDTRQATLVNALDIQDGRHVVPLRTLTYQYGKSILSPINTVPDPPYPPPKEGQQYYWPPTADPETPVICTRWASNGAWGDVCYTEYGQMDLLLGTGRDGELLHPGWATWYLALTGRVAKVLPTLNYWVIKVRTYAE